ncbi:MAG: 23S rRNA (guanosine(2251)-2'-O)-methyltransferase RlmB [Pseudomonadota bacterium]
MVTIQSLSAIEHILRHKPERILSLSCQPLSKPSPRLEGILHLAKELGLSIGSHAKKEPFSEPVIANLKPFEYANWSDWIAGLKDDPKALVLALDHLQDPQNLGALCRTAEALGVRGVIIPKDRSVTVTPGAYHASVGAVETIPILQVTNLNEALRKLKDEQFWIVGAALGEDSKPLKDTPSFDKVALVLGTELEGLKPLTLATCDWLTEIPLKGKVQSLNVSAAGAILMFEFSRRF